MEQIDNLQTSKKFKKTEIGEIPVDWAIVELHSVMQSYISGIWGKDPTDTKNIYPVIRSTEISSNGKIDLSTVVWRQIPADKVLRYELLDNDILLVASSGSPQLIGRPALFHRVGDGKRYLFSNFMTRIRAGNIDSKYLYYFLNSHLYSNFLKFLQQTSTGLRNLPKTEFIKMKLPYPSFQEQKKIAEILTAVDDAIEKSDGVIEKTKQLKKGLMQELLTRGIGHKKFKNTEIGEIPVDWKIAILKDMTSLITKGTTPTTYGHSFKTEGITFLKVENIDENGKILKDNMQFISKETHEFLARSKLMENDILFSIAGALGRIAIISDDILPANINQALAVIRQSNNETNIKFLFYMLQSQNITKQINGMVKQLAQANLNLQQIASFKIPTPLRMEQDKIAEILTAVDQEIDEAIENRIKLNTIKQGLMQVLLTGRVRVKI